MFNKQGMRFGFEFYIDEDRWGIRLWNWFLKLGYIKPDYNRDIWHSYGFCYSDRALHFRAGHKTKLFWMPWDRGSNIRHEVMNTKGELEMAKEMKESICRIALRKAGVKGYYPIEIGDDRKMYSSPYAYKLHSGEVQNRTAKYFVEEREWRWRIFHPYRIGPKIVSRCISVEFSDEVGERTGSWKGGTTGCGYEMLPGESPEQTLRRMEKERKFR